MIEQTINPTAVSPERLAANRANAKLSTGPGPIGLAVSCLNHTIHGLARHSNGTFKLLTSEDPAGFEALKKSLAAEHQASTTTESILVNAMAESLWLGQRAQRLQDTCIDPNTGAIIDEKKASLYLRYFTTHTRTFHKSLNDLLKLRSEKRKEAVGFEAQKRKEEEMRLKNERHELKKQAQAVDLAKKEAQTRHQMAENAIQQGRARWEVRNFETIFAEELAKSAAAKEEKPAAAQAA
jgi:low affinity Fe/Cu permease